MNTSVNFEIAKLLKEKGFHEKCTSFYDLISSNQIDDAPLGNYNLTKQSVSIPTIADVVMWLYEKHGIWISVHEENCRGYVGFDFNIVFVGDHETTVTQQEIQYKLLGETVFNSPTEAYEAAIEYTLNNLV